MTVGDRTVKFDVEEFGIRVPKEEAIAKAEESEGLDPEDDDDVDEAAKRIAVRKFHDVATEITGQYETDVARTVYEGYR